MTVSPSGQPAAAAAATAAPTATSSLLADLLISLRPKQWTKNLILYMALLFAVNLHWNPAEGERALSLLLRTTAGFLLFCTLSSGIYLLNDVMDREGDRLHPRKRRRPVAAGRLGPGMALGAALVLVGTSLLLGLLLSPPFAAAQAAYVALMAAYSLWLKHLVILDVLTIAGGFLLRAHAGGLITAIPISPWLSVCAALGALFLGFSKRRHELRLLEEDAANHRPILGQYSLSLLDQMLGVVTSSTVIAYSLYTFTAEALPANHAMMLTIPFVLYGIFRYLYLINMRGMGGSPEEVLLRDRPLLLDILLWAAASAAILLLFR